jgi:hypothetical protein
MSEVKVNKISPRSGTTITLGDSGDTFTIPSGVTFDASSGGLAGTLTTAAQPNITSVGTLTSLNVDASAGTGVIGITLDNGTISTSKDSSSFRSQFSMYNTTGQVAKFDTASDDLFLRFADDLAFQSIAGSEYMRIDSSGTLLVAGTDTDPSANNASGIALKENGKVSATRDGSISGDFNRQTSDGDIVLFRKDGTTVGSIGVSNGDNLYIDGVVSGHGGISFGSTSWLPRSGGAFADNAVDIGNNGNYIKDIYIKGGIRFGTNTSANKLDDYEEGTWTPSLSTAGGTLSVTYSERTSKYTKIGNVVYYQFFIETSAFSGGTGAITFSGLPFTAQAGRSAVGLATGSRIDLGLESAAVLPTQNSSNFRIMIKNSTGTGSSQNLSALDASDWSNLFPTNIYGSGFYLTDA